MLAPLLSMLLAVPFAPVVQSPAPEAWTVGTRAEFNSGDYADDAGVAAKSVVLEFRRDDAGYGAMSETFPFDSYVYPTLPFPVEGTRWCWRARHVNTLNEVSDPSDERCFRTDFTEPVSGFVDAGAIVSDGLVVLDMQPATDNLSGVHGYFLELAPSATSWPSGWGADVQLPLVTYVGEGSWFGWVLVRDNAGNVNGSELGNYLVPITITASPAVPVPDAPHFERTVTNGWGDLLDWDAGWMPDAGVTHVVSSFCKLDAGCEWRHGFHGLPVTSTAWQQLEGEGPMVARIAVVVGGQVGSWSPPSLPLNVDRTPPEKPLPPTSLPTAARMGPLAVSWSAATDDFTGVEHYVVQLSQGGVAVLSQTPNLSTSLTTAGDGRYEVRVAAVDVAGNQGEFSDRAISIIDSTGPQSQRPVATASAIDGGALVSITWSLPTDALSNVASMELRESLIDGGSSQVVSVTGLSASRTVTPGQWHWELRGTDSLGNVGLFSEPSNVILVTAQGVVNGPSIPATELTGRCGEPLSATLVGHGDAPLTWSLSAGPQGLAVSSAGELTWTPPAGHAGTEVAQVQLSNAAGSVSGEVSVVISCGSADQDAGVTQQTQRSLLVGCGCSAVDPLFLVLGLLLLRRR